MKIEHHYSLQTKLMPCINNIIEAAVTYFKRILKTALKHVTMLMSSWQRLSGLEWVQNPKPWTPGHWCCHPCDLVTPPKVLAYFAHCCVVNVTWGKLSISDCTVLVLQECSLTFQFTRKPSRCKGKCVTAVRACRPLAKKSTANQRYAISILLKGTFSGVQFCHWQ